MQPYLPIYLSIQDSNKKYYANDLQAKVNEKWSSISQLIALLTIFMSIF